MPRTESRFYLWIESQLPSQCSHCSSSCRTFDISISHINYQNIDTFKKNISKISFFQNIDINIEREFWKISIKYWINKDLAYIDIDIYQTPLSRLLPWPKEKVLWHACSPVPAFRSLLDLWATFGPHSGHFWVTLISLRRAPIATPHLDGSMLLTRGFGMQSPQLEAGGSTKRC